MSKRVKRNLIEGDIKTHLFRLTWPMLIGMMGIVIFNLVDTYFVGRLGVQQLAAMSFTFPVVMFINSISHGIGIGTSSLIARNIIATDRDKVKVMAGRALLLGVLVIIVFVIIGELTIDPLFRALGANDELLGYIHDYMRIWYFGVPFVVIPQIGNNILRGSGDTFTPGMIMLNSAVINVVLDPLLIFGIGPFPEMGLQGAALATVISRSVSMVIVLYLLIKRHNLITLRFGRVREIFQTWKQVVYIAGPASLAMLITPISIGFITRIISGFGKEAVAAFGVASRIEMFALMVISSLGSVLIIFIGQNISKLKFDRINEALKLSSRFSIIWGVVVFLLLLLLGRGVAGLFTDDGMVIEMTRSYFLIIGASYGFLGLVMLSTASFNGINKPYPSAIFSIIRMLILYVPLAWIGSKFFGLNGVFWAGLLANVIVGISSFFYLRRTLTTMEGTESEEVVLQG